MNRKHIYYSCSSWLSYEICQRYYRQRHYAWCSPYFDACSKLNAPNSVPPSSNPRDIYWNLKSDVDAGDLHSAKIKDIRRSLQRGAALKLQAGIIDRPAYKEILEIVKRSQLKDFKPLMFVIPVYPVAHLFIPVGIKSRANFLSEEYIIKNLFRDFFDAFEL